MSGGRFLNSLLLGLLFWGAFTSPAFASGRGPVVVFLSDEEAAYSQPVAAFVHEVELPVEVFNLQGDVKRAPALMAEILARKPSLIFALGAKAAYIAKTWTSDRADVPVIFAMVLNWQRYDLLRGQDNIAGIASEVEPGTQLANISMFYLQARRIGVIYSDEHSARTVADAKNAAEKLGFELVTEPILRPRDFERAFKKMAGRIDVFWILNDPVVYTVDNVSWLEERCVRERLACIGQSENVAKLGMLLAIDPDIPSMGSQAASMAKGILLHNQNPRQIGVVPPLGTRIFLNMKTARRIGVPINPAALNMTSEIIEK